MKISIVTVCRNSESTIRSAIESVLAQTYQDIEYIIVDGASTDGTLSIVNEYRERIAHIISEPDNGIYDAMNKGIKIAGGDFLGILNSDDFFASPDIIGGLVEFLTENPQLDGTYGDIVFVDKKNVERVVRMYSSQDFSPKQLRWGIMFPHATFYVRRELFDSFGLYKLDYPVVSDFELVVRFIKRGISIGRYPRVMVKMRNGGVSNTSIWSVLRHNFDIARACRENGIYSNILMMLPKIPFKLIGYIKPRI